MDLEPPYLRYQEADPVMKDRTKTLPRAPHPDDNVHTVTNPTQPDEALRRVVADQIGPRTEGVVYDNSSGIFQVLQVIRDLSEARRILKRRAAQFAIEVVDLHTGSRHYTGSVWTGSDRVLKAVTV